MNAESALPISARIDDAWSAATERVECYLRAHRLTSDRQVSRLTAEIISLAQARQQPGDDALVLAMETVEAAMAAWFASLVPTTGIKEPQQLARGRMALAMGEVPARWPEYFLREGALPAELVRVMGEADLGRAPEIRFSNMAPRVTLVPAVAAAAARPRLQLSYRWPFVRVVTGLVVVLSLLSATIAAGL